MILGQLGIIGFLAPGYLDEDFGHLCSLFPLLFLESLCRLPGVNVCYVGFNLLLTITVRF